MIGCFRQENLGQVVRIHGRGCTILFLRAFEAEGDNVCGVVRVWITFFSIRDKA